MEEKLNQFFEQSALAQKIKLQPRIILHRSTMLPAGIANLTETGKYNPIKKSDLTCELEIGGKVIAQGKIIKKWGKSYFKIKQMTK